MVIKSFDAETYGLKEIGMNYFHPYFYIESWS